jgi:hypothetical protein
VCAARCPLLGRGSRRASGCDRSKAVVGAFTADADLGTGRRDECFGSRVALQGRQRRQCFGDRVTVNLGDVEDPRRFRYAAATVVVILLRIGLDVVLLVKDDERGLLALRT